MIELACNTRFRHRPLTGVERFASETIARLAERPDLGLREIDPGRPLAALRGHAWEQIALPRKVAPGEVLFSPCNTGPVLVERQLVVIHDAAVWDRPEGFSRPFRMVYRQLLPALAERSAAVATVSEFSRQRLAECLGLPAERIAVISFR